MKRLLILPALLVLVLGFAPFADAVRFGETMRRVAAQTEDAAEGRAARAERRPPVWRGR